MKRYNRISKRLLAIALTLTMIISAFSGALSVISSALTEGTDFTVTNNTTISSESIVKGNAKLQFFNGTDTVSSSATKIEAITDGNFTSNPEFQTSYTQAPFFSLKDGHVATEKTYSSIDTWYVGGERYWDAILTLEDNASIENIVLVNHSNSNLMTGHFAVFASDSTATLFDNANLIKDVRNETAKQQVYNFTFPEGKELIGKKYVALRIYNPVTDTSESAIGGLISSNGCKIIYPRLFEFNVFGTATKTDFEVVTEDNAQEIPSDVDTIAVSSLESKFYKNGVETYSASNSTDSNVAALIDGKADGEGQFMRSDFACTYYDMETGTEHITDGKHHQDFIYTMKSDFVVKDIVVINHGTADLKTGKYQIFMGDDKDTLFSNPAKTYTYENSGNYRRQIFKVNGDQGFPYKYAGVRVINPIQDVNTFSRLNEFAVVRMFEFNFYGSSTSSSSDIATTVTKDDNTTLPSGDNLVSGMIPKVIHYVNNEKKADSFSEITSELSDANPATIDHTGAQAVCATMEGTTVKVLTEADGCYTNLYYNLGDECTISSVLLFHHSNPRIRANEFKLYISNTEADLYKSKSFVGTYSTEGKLRNVISLDTPVKGKFVGIRVTDVLYDKTWASAATDIYLRLADFVVFGEKPVNNNRITLSSSTNDATKVIGKTVAVTDMQIYYTNPTTGNRGGIGTYTTATNPDGSVRTGLDVLTDDVMTKEVELSAAKFATESGGTKTVYTDGTALADIVYTLDGRTDISDIVVVGHKDDIWKVSYKLYMSDSTVDLFDSSNMVYNFNNMESKMRTQHFTTPDMSYRYVGMRIYSATTSTVVSYGASSIYPRLFQFNVYGEKSANQSVANVTEADSTAVPDGTSVVTNVSAKFYDGSKYEASAVANAEYLYDKDIATAGNVFSADASAAFSADSGKYYDLIVKLTYTSTINKVFVFGDADANSYPQNYEIYASTNVNKLFDASSLVCEYENANSKRAQTFTLPALSAAYVGLRVYAPAKTANSVLKLLEFNVFGTPGEAANDNVDAGTTIPENNFLQGISATTSVTVKGDTQAHGATNADAITDGTAESAQWHIGTTANRPEYVLKNEQTGLWEVVRDGSVYTDVTFDLGGTATLEKIYVAHHQNEVIRTTWFAVYASENLNDLYNEENLIKEVKNTKGFRANTITLDSPLSGIRAIGIRIYDPCFDYSSGTCSFSQSALDENYTHAIYARLAEVAACGSFEKDKFILSKNNPFPNTKLPDEIQLNEERNLTKNIVAGGRFVDTNDGSSASTAYDAPFNLTDGDFSTECQINNRFAHWVSGAPQYDNLTGRYYLDIKYNLQSPAFLDYLVIANHKSRELVTGKFDVFVGNDDEAMFEDPAYVSVDNISLYNEGSTARLNVIYFDDTVGAVQYVVIRIYDPVSAVGVGSATVTEERSNIYARIMEASVYGEYEDPNFAPEPPKEYMTTEGFDLSTLTEIYGANLLADQNVNCVVNNIKKGNSVEEKKWMNNLKDLIKAGTAETHIDIYGGVSEHHTDGHPLNLYWKMDTMGGDVAKVNGFAYQGISSNSVPYYTAHYKIYVAEEIEDLWTEESCVFEYNALDGDKIQKGVIYEFPKDTAIYGAYFGLQIIENCYSAEQHKYPRISLVHVWGEEGELPGAPGNLAENMPISPSFVNDGEKTEIPESNLSAKETANLTDSDTSTKAKINTKGSNRETVEILYNLCGDMKIDSIWVSALINKTSGFKKMKVYASDDLAGVNGEDSLIWTYKVGSKTGTIKPTKTFKKQLKARYVRFVFEDTKNYVTLNEIYVNGLDNQKMKTRNITNTISSSDVTVTKTNKGEKKQYINPPNLGRLIDNDQTSYVEIRDGGVVGETSYDFLLYLQDLRTISKLELMFIKNFQDYWPKKINVYVGETIADVEPEYDPEISFTLTSKDISKDGKIVKQLRPMLGRYIRFEIVDSVKNPLYKTESGEYEAVFCISDFKITGTKVKGMQTSETSTALLEFTDEKTGAGMVINRLDTNDIFTDAVSIKITPETATNWQMKDLQEIPFLKVVDKKVYKVELLDLYGNKVDNFGGRTLQAKFILPKGANPENYMIGNATDRTKMVCLDTYSVDGAVYAEFVWTEGKDNKIALLEMTTENDPYWATIGELENFEEGDANSLISDPMLELYPDAIITTDKRFIVNGYDYTIDEGVKFTAKDVSADVDESLYEAVLTYFADPAMTVAAVYDMEMTQNGSKYSIPDAFTDVRLNLPDYIAYNYTGLQVVHIDDLGNCEWLWSEATDEQLHFSTQSFSYFAILGVRNDGDFIYGDIPEGTSPDTGENVGTVAAALLSLAAAAYVAMNFAKKREEQEN